MRLRAQRSKNRGFLGYPEQLEIRAWGSESGCGWKELSETRKNTDGCWHPGIIG